MHIGHVPLIILLLSVFSSTALAQRGGRIPIVGLQTVYSAHSFDRPLDLQFVGQGNGTGDPDPAAFVVEQGGVIWHLPSTSSPTRTQTVDLSALIEGDGFEQGLLGLALHPSFATNGLMFVNYTRADDGATVIARLTFDAVSKTASLDSKVDILTVAQPFSNHNAGSLVFGKDGFLYVPLGDGGSGGDPQRNAQNRQTLLGKILRIDVDRPSADGMYSIPRGNPYRNGRSGFRPEIFAYGFRNPFKLTVDSATGALWTGDVGQGSFEEIDIVRRGRNYGWNRLEGFECYPPGSSCSNRGAVRPVWAYGRSEGESVTGGYVYRGRAIRTLRGRYVYGDFASGRIWALRRTRRGYRNVELLDTSDGISSFGQSPDGELFVVTYGGTLFRLVPG